MIDLCDHDTDDIVDSRETSNQSGDSPIWNEAFHFELLSKELNDHYVELTGN